MKKLYIFLILLLLFTTQINSQTTLPYFQDFETGIFLPTDWELFSRPNTATADWELSPMGVGASNSSYSVMFNNANSPGEYFVLRSVALDLSDAIAPIVSFDVAYARYDSNNSDILSFWFNTNVNSSLGWNEVVDATTMLNVSYTRDELDTALPQTTYFTPANNQWENKTIDLSEYAGVGYIRFAFESVPDNDGGNVIYIDNVHFYESSPLTITNQQKTKFVVSPNPTNGVIQINTSIRNLSNTDFRIFNTLGQLQNNGGVYQNNAGYQLNLNHFKKGVYFIAINSSETKIIIIQ